ncbi:hypothetical protein SERLADRAFT_404741 [Serpula lacrymans var. lacrymans S7.9]|uniref:Uncharacterized protein n=1 Tax=Serpula lacrymans var. lacrymans (strain S7.9) TaxID=578457 RepID=F8NEN9_SERL9|nr:uncharacterized protein SERLADRAFT_404741 [Serpula lacrymans var. lacrymans S7.9]EGO30673.1 hypothetical protein SERLADRAFT_404741 [Serpula lacrymans var. lacrymans S7.9]
MAISSAQQKAILSWANELLAHNVPTLYALKKCQDKICNLVCNPTKKKTTNSGNIFYPNLVGKAIAKDYSNPITRHIMQDYPEEGDGTMSQVHHGNKMLLDLPPSLAVPSILVNGKIYIINELLQQINSTYFIPKKLFQSRAEEGNVEILAIGHSVMPSEAGFIVDPGRVIGPTSTFTRTFIKIQTDPLEFSGLTDCGLDSSAHFATQMPNPLLVLTVPLIVFMDDVLGNVSKQWNKHHVVYLSNASMPQEMLEKEFCVRFVSSSPHAAPMELMKWVTKSICEAADFGVITWDCRSQKIVQQLLALGKQLQKREAGKPALPESEVRQQLEQKPETLLHDSTLDNHISPLSGMPAVDIHQDTPTEILHTVLLGVVKQGLNPSARTALIQYNLGQNTYVVSRAVSLANISKVWPRLNSREPSKTSQISQQNARQFTATAKLLAGIAANPLHHKMPSNTLLQGGTGVTLQLETGSVQNGDEAKLGSHVVISSPSNGANPCVGKVEEILVTEKKPRVAAYIAVTYLEFQPFLYSKLQIPILRITEAQNILTAEFPLNFAPKLLG